MKLFLREHLPLIGVNAAQLFLVLLIYWLDGYRNAPTALYSVFVGLVLLSAYLAYRYFSHRRFYERLSLPPETLDEAVRTVGAAPLPKALEELLHALHRLYRDRLHEGESRRRAHLTFINQWVHQMKTPISVIQLTAQEEEDPRFASIREEAERIERGLEAVLYAARLESFETDFAVERVNLRKAAERAVHENKRLFIRNGVYPEIDVDPALHAETDAKWLHFILNQLLSNATKYAAGTHTKITISAKTSPHALRLEVRDRGVGIPARDLKRVFEPFFTGENGRRFRESTGMGLYLAHEVCRRLGHRIELESKEGEGTAAAVFFQSWDRNLT